MQTLCNIKKEIIFLQLFKKQTVFKTKISEYT